MRDSYCTAERVSGIRVPACPPLAGALNIFCGNLLHHLDFEVTLGPQFLQSGVLLFAPAQPLDLIGVQGQWANRLALYRQVAPR